jgi:hypothetical protein
VSQLGTVTWLVVRELWISFRLLAVLGLLLLAAVAVVLLPPTLFGTPPERYAIFIGIAVWVSAALVAGSFALERRRGSAGWVVSRGVKRRTLLLGWVAAFGLVLVGGMAPGALLAWLVLIGLGVPLEPVTFALAVGVIAAGALAALGVALLTGALLPPVVAAFATLVVAGSLLAASVLTPVAETLLPSSGNLLVARLIAEPPSLGTLLRALGAALVAAAALLALAGLAFERAEL